MASQDELVRRELQLRQEIVTHELRCLTEDDAPMEQFDAKLEEWELIMARREAMARRDALRRKYANH